MAENAGRPDRDGVIRRVTHARFNQLKADFLRRSGERKRSRKRRAADTDSDHDEHDRQGDD